MSNLQTASVCAGKAWQREGTITASGKGVSQDSRGLGHMDEARRVTMTVWKSSTSVAGRLRRTFGNRERCTIQVCRFEL